MTSVANIGFRGHESAGSIGYSKNSPVECPTCGSVNFKGDSFEYSESKKKNKGLKVALGLTATAAVVIGGLACANKYADKLPKWLKGLGDNGVSETCHKWCSKVKGFFVSKNKA